jgi:shikimate kinase
MKIVITGFMGCGKSSVARELAQRLHLEMIDLDESITRREGRTPAQIMVEKGEAAFRAIESEALRELLQTDAACLIALGGGAWIEETNRELIEQHGYFSVWLDVPFEICWGRIKASSEERPLGNSRSQALRLYERRRPVYELANIHIQVGNEEFASLLSRIERELVTRLQDLQD